MTLTSTPFSYIPTPISSLFLTCSLISELQSQKRMVFWLDFVVDRGGGIVLGAESEPKAQLVAHL